MQHRVGTRVRQRTGRVGRAGADERAESGGGTRTAGSGRAGGTLTWQRESARAYATAGRVGRADPNGQVGSRGRDTTV